MTMDATALIHIGENEGRETNTRKRGLNNSMLLSRRVCGREKASINASCNERELERVRAWCDSGGMGGKKVRNSRSE